VAGSVQVSPSAGGVTLAASISGLTPGGSYLADADPLPCEIFAGGPSQSFPKAFVAGEGGTATVTWTVPAGMDGSASIQRLSGATYEVLACADLG
jgi:hypothetical protein